MLIFHSLPRAARNTLTRKLRRALPRLKTLEYYEPMRVVKERPPLPGELPIILDPDCKRLYRVDPWRLRNVEFSFGLFSARLLTKRAGDFALIFLRHPVERFYSAYFYIHHRLKTLRADHANSVTAVRYIERYPEMVELFRRDQQSFVDYFLDHAGEILFERQGLVYGPIEESFAIPKNLDVYDFVGVTERMDASLARLSDHLGVRLVNDEVANRGPATGEPRHREEDVRHFYAPEIEVYEHYAAALS